jgi:trimeric autotransporter adhesin
MRSVLRLVPAAAVACALAAPAAAQASPYNTAVLADGPQEYYQLDESSGTVAADATGHFAGAYAGGAILAAQAPFADAGTAVNLDTAGTVKASPLPTPHSIELWVKPAVNNVQQSIATYGDPAAGGWTIGTTNKKKLVFKTDGNNTRSRMSLPTGRWTMVLVTWSSSKVRFFTNGGAQAKAFNLQGSAPSANDAQLTIGDGPLGHFKGTVDEVALFSGELTKTQFATQFAASHYPVNVTSPTVTAPSPPHPGDVLTGTPGTWNPSTGLTFTYQWSRCDVNGDCVDIDGAISKSYTVTDADVGQQLQLEETGTNLALNATASLSDPTDFVQALPVDPGTGGTGGDGTGGTGGTGGDITGAGATTGDTTAGTSSSTTTADASSTTSPTVLGADVSSAQCGRLTALPKPKRVRMGKFRVTVSVKTGLNGKSPFKLSLKTPKGKMKSVTYRLDGKVLRHPRKSPFSASISSAGLKPGAHTLRIKLSPRTGKARTVTMRLQLGGC